MKQSLHETANNLTTNSPISTKQKPVDSPFNALNATFWDQID